MNLRPARWESALAFTIAISRTALCAYRAAHQSMTIDEAHTFNFYVAGPWSNFYARYIPHNHVLFSLVARASVALFGTSELAFRLPTVIAGFFLILGVFRLLQFMQSPVLRWIALIAIALHPLLLDFSVAARGYGLGLALLVWAMDFAMRGRHAFSGVLFGLAISAQLSMLIPAAAAIAGLIIIERRIRPAAMSALCAAVVAMAICAAPLHTADPSVFNFGYLTFRESIYSLVFPSTTDRAGMFVGPHTTGAFVEIGLVLIIAAFIAIEGIRGAIAKPRAALLPAIMFGLASGAVLASHFLLGRSYPTDRTGLYLILLFGIAWAMTTDAANSRAVRIVNVLIACGFIMQFTAQIDTRSFRVWKFDMDTRRVAQLLAQECRAKPPSSVTVSSVWINQQALEYYRRTIPIPALQPVLYQDPAPLSGYDYYVLNAGDHVRLDPREWRILFEGPESGTILAVRR